MADSTDPQSSEQGRDPHDEFLRLFSQHAKKIYHFALTITLNHADAEEVFQNTCVVLWRKFASYDPQGSFFSWACKIAHLEMLDLSRQGRRMTNLSEDVLEVLVEEMAVYSVHAAVRQEALEDCVRKLKLADRALVESRYYRHQAPKEIARTTSRSVYSIYRALARIHTQLRECVERTLARERLG